LAVDALNILMWLLSLTRPGRVHDLAARLWAWLRYNHRENTVTFFLRPAQYNFGSAHANDIGTDMEW